MDDESDMDELRGRREKEGRDGRPEPGSSACKLHDSNHADDQEN